MGRTLVGSSTFTGTDGTHPSGFDDLCNGSGQIEIISNSIHAPYSTLPLDDRITGTYSVDQYAKIAVSGFNTGSEGSRMGVILRASTQVGTARDMYRIYVTNDATDSLKCDRVINNAATNLRNDTSQTWANGDTVEAEVTGSGATVTIKLFRNGVQVGTDISDTDANRLLTGNPGTHCYLGAEDILRGDNFEAGDVTAGGGQPTRSMHQFTMRTAS